MVYREGEEQPAARDAVWGLPDGLRRGLLVGLSVVGVFAAAGLWFAGHAYLALRVLALDVVLATAILLVA